MLTRDLIAEAAEFLDGRVRRTPVERSPWLSDALGAPVWLKLENLQITGSFKVRGAWFACAKLFSEGIREIGTCSAGNHGNGVALAASELGMSATIFVPSSVDEGKHREMVRLGANVVVSEFDGYDDTERWARGEIDRLGLFFLSAYDDDRVMAGNGGSVAREVLEQVPDARTFVMPAGGGGHAAGFAFEASASVARPRFVLCQHVESPALRLSLERGEAVTELPGIRTLASGLEGGFGRRTFEVLKDLRPEVALVSEEDIRDAMRWMLEHHQYVVEGSAAAPVAACRTGEVRVPEGSVVVFISGRNVDLRKIRDVLCG
jgi:threonine dehydratase